MQRPQRGVTLLPCVRDRLTLAVQGLVKGWEEDRLGVVSLPLNGKSGSLLLMCFS